MILVDVMVPAAGRRYDFELEETITVDVIIREMLEVVYQKEHRQFKDNVDSLCLYSIEKQRRLLPDWTLHQCGVRSGESLILV